MINRLTGPLMDSMGSEPMGWIVDPVYEMVWIMLRWGPGSRSNDDSGAYM